MSGATGDPEPGAAGARLIEAVQAGDASTVAELVSAEPSLAATRDAHGVSALLLARYRSDRPVMDALLAVDPDLDVFEAAAYGYLDRLVERLEEDPTGTASRSSDGFTPLHLAAFFGKAEAVKALLEAGAPVDAVTANDLANQPLHAAAAGRSIETCRLLLAAGAEVDARQHGGFTPLHEAAQSGDAGMVELFLSAGADPTAPASDGRSPAEIARDAGHGDVATRLAGVAAERAG
jgi:ankyrin repeat protein